MILIADGGSSKTDWRIINKGVNHVFHTRGINPFHNSEDQIMDEIHRSDVIKFRSGITEIHFYGAGLANENIKGELHQIFKKVFPFTQQIYIYDDLLAAARALFKDNQGIVCILGTGSNSCFYNGTVVEDKVPSLGYILGDEGSGARMGIRFINGFFKREFSEELSIKLKKESQLVYADVLDNVYKKHLPNRYLASFTKMMNRYIDYVEVRGIIKESFVQFIDKNVSKYSESKSYPIGFVGSIAYYFRDILEEVMEEKGLKLAGIIQAPIEELINFHTVN
jgi:N-acetylglucosamine kinase-like BadF-type ATPase